MVMKQGVEPEPPPSRTTPPHWLRDAPVTRAIVALNLLVFVVQVALARERVVGADGVERIQWAAGAILHVPATESLLFGANYALATVSEHRIETLVTSCFLHAGILHVGLNMLVLWQAGPVVERAVGAARMAPMYLFAGIVGSVCSTAINWIGRRESFSVGASGAIMGVLAAAMVLGWRAQGWKGPFTQTMARWLGANLVLGIVFTQVGGNTDNAAHIGGAIAGAVAAMLWRRGYVYSRSAKASILAACALVVAVSGATVALRDASDPFAAMTADQRVLVATRARLKGQCAEARRVLMATHRLNPQNEKLAKERFAYAVDCGGSI